jgi:hypothetical protein
MTKSEISIKKNKITSIQKELGLASIVHLSSTDPAIGQYSATKPTQQNLQRGTCPCPAALQILLIGHLKIPAS